MIYKITLSTENNLIRSLILDAVSEQELINKVAYKLEHEGSVFVSTKEELLALRESGQSVEDYVTANNLVYCETNDVYLSIKSIFKMPFTEKGENAFIAMNDIGAESHRENYAKHSAFNFASYMLFHHQELAYQVMEDVANSKAIRKCPPYSELTFSFDEVLEELSEMLDDGCISEKTFKLPVTWEMCGFVEVKAKTLIKAIKTFNETKDYVALPKEKEYVNASFSLSTDDVELIKSYN